MVTNIFSNMNPVLLICARVFVDARQGPFLLALGKQLPPDILAGLVVGQACGTFPYLAGWKESFQG